MKKIIILSLAFVLCFNFLTFSAPLSNIAVEFDTVNLFVNGDKVETPTILYNDRTYVPLRAVTDNMDADIIWDAETNTAKVFTGERTRQCIRIMDLYRYIDVTIKYMKTITEDTRGYINDICNAYYTGNYNMAYTYIADAKSLQEGLSSLENGINKLDNSASFLENVYSEVYNEEYISYLKSSKVTLLSIKNVLAEYLNTIFSMNQYNCMQLADDSLYRYSNIMNVLNMDNQLMSNAYYYYYDLSMDFIFDIDE